MLFGRAALNNWKGFLSKVFENSVIPVVPVIDTQINNNMEGDGFEQVQLTNQIENIYRRWKHEDTWACKNCNDR